MDHPVKHRRRHDRMSSSAAASQDVEPRLPSRVTSSSAMSVKCAIRAGRTANGPHKVSADLVDQREAERVTGWVCEDKTMGSVRLVLEAPGARSHNPCGRTLQVVYEEVDVDQR